MEDSEPISLFMPNKSGVLVTGEAASLIQGKTATCHRRNKIGRYDQQNRKKVFSHFVNARVARDPIPSAGGCYLLGRLLKPKINLGRKIKFLVLFHHANYFSGVQMVNPLLRKSKLFVIQISVFLVAIRTKDRLG